MKIISTETLILIPLKESHADELYQLLQDQRIFSYIPEEPPQSLEALRQRYAFLEKGKSGAKRMAESAAHLVDEVLPFKPLRQWVLSFPFPLRLLFAKDPHLTSQVLNLVLRAISNFLIKKAGLKRKLGAKTGSVTLDRAKKVDFF